MPKLKLGPILDDRPVKLGVELPADLHRDLVAYAEALSRETGQQVEPTKLVAPMLARFLASDRGFRSARRPAPRSRALNSHPAPPPREPAA
jgi:hypothetical protein